MEEIKLYYTPKITDIRVGYIYEFNGGSTVADDGSFVENWNETIVTDAHSLAAVSVAIRDGDIRTKYLTIEDIIALGWEDEGQIIPQEGVTSDKPINLRKFRKKHYIIIYDFVARVVMIAILMGDIFSVCIQRYDCPSINELTYILSSLNLNLS